MPPIQRTPEGKSVVDGCVGNGEMLVEKIEFGGDAEVPANGAFDVLMKALFEEKDSTVHVHDPATSAVDLGQIERIVTK